MTNYRTYGWTQALRHSEERLPSVEGRCERSIAQFERACLVLLRDEQEKPNPDSALIAVLCDAVRLSREFSEYTPTV